MAAVRSEYVIIGGGLGGMTAAYLLGLAGRDVVLIDRSLPEAKGALGGFTRFSGAKFSLLPAGQGLINVAGGIENLQRILREILDLCGLESSRILESVDVLEDKPLLAGAKIRTYESIVLTPVEVGHAVQSISSRVRQLVRVIDAEINEIRLLSSRWVAYSSEGEVAKGRVAMFAGGRTGGALLRRAGATPQQGKGVDLGVRVEFLNRESITPLRALGPDAKILIDQTRTFCLNYPGTVFRYPFLDFSIPGGVVADQLEPSANFGILSRVREKEFAIARVLNALRSVPRSSFEQVPVVKGLPFQDKQPMLELAYGIETANLLQQFGRRLGELGLVDWNSAHRIHFPLLDWHWDTFALNKSHKTDQLNLLVAGDSAGHARGLLQAGASGWLAAREALADESP